MPKYGNKSKQQLSTCHPDLQKLFNEVIKYYDCSIICGHRNKEDQDKAVKGGFSKVVFPNSKHNSIPSRAVDVAPYNNGINWNDRESFYYMAGIVMGIASQMGIKIRWGGDFNRDQNLHNDNFLDLPHFELDN